MKPGIHYEGECARALPAQSGGMPVLVARQLSSTRAWYDGRGAVRAADHDHGTVAGARPSAAESGHQMRERFRSMGPVTQGCAGAHAAYAEHADAARCEQSFSYTAQC